MKRVILTGASGYLGSKIGDKFLQNGFYLLCPLLREPFSAYFEPLSERVKIVYTDDPAFYEKVTAFSAGYVIHTACRYDREGISLQEVFDANMTFPLLVLDAVLKGEKKVLWLNTDTALDKMINAYSLSKHQFAEWGNYFANQGKIDFVNVLLEQFFGEGDSGSKFIPFLLNKMLHNEALDLTDGMQQRDFIYVDDVVDAFLILCNKRPQGYMEVPLGTGEAPQVREVVEYLATLVGTESELRFGVLGKRPLEPDISVADVSVLKQMGFQCRYTWQEGLKKMVEELH